VTRDRWVGSVFNDLAGIMGRSTCVPLAVRTPGGVLFGGFEVCAALQSVQLCDAVTVVVRELCGGQMEFKGRLADDPFVLACRIARWLGPRFSR